MAQQINLINPELRPKKELLTAVFMAWVVFAFTLVLGGYAWSLSHEAGKLSQQREEWVRRAQDEQNKLVQVTQQNPVRAASQGLQEEIKAAEERLSEREKVFEVLKSGAVGGNGGFSGLMQAFARQSVNGLWLTGFSANGAGDQMRINGRALSPDLIPQYIGKLSSEQALRGRLFTALQVSQPKQDTSLNASKASQQKDMPPAAAALPSYVEFVLSADKPVDTSSAKATMPSGAKS